MLDSLEAAGRLEGALIIVTADHGEEFFEHQSRGHRATLFDEVLRIPLLIRDPGEKTARHVGAQVGLVDVLPTIAGFAGLEPPATSTGVDLGPAARGAALESRPMISSLMQYHGEFGYFFIESYRLPDSKLIRSMSLEDDRLVLMRGQLFDLSSDPAELNSLVTKGSVRDTRRWPEMQAAFDRLRELQAKSSPAPRSERTTSVREIFVDKLAGLGYAGEDGDTSQLASPGMALPWPPGARREPEDTPAD
jgi:arylsulfatase A-like enzyme